MWHVKCEFEIGQPGYYLHLNAAESKIKFGFFDGDGVTGINFSDESEINGQPSKYSKMPKMNTRGCIIEDRISEIGLRV